MVNFDKRTSPFLRHVPQAVVALAGALVISIGVAGCGGDDGKSLSPEAVAKQKADRCDYPGLPLPSAATVDSVEDPREGDILVCDYLNDIGFPANKPFRLLDGVTPQHFNLEHFSLTGSFGEWLLLGTTSLDSNTAAQGQAEQERVYAMVVESSEPDVYIPMTIPQNKVRIRLCAETCEPTVTVNVDPNQRLFSRNSDKDISSIWQSDAPDDPYDGGWERFNAVSAVARLLPREKAVENVAEKGSVTGGPKSPGEVISALAGTVTITMPRSIYARVRTASEE